MVYPLRHLGLLLALVLGLLVAVTLVRPLLGVAEDDLVRRAISYPPLGPIDVVALTGWVTLFSAPGMMLRVAAEALVADGGESRKSRAPWRRVVWGGVVLAGALCLGQALLGFISLADSIGRREALPVAAGTVALLSLGRCYALALGSRHVARPRFVVLEVVALVALGTLVGWYVVGSWS